jgi:non-specific serine/threonine protein kinase
LRGPQGLAAVDVGSDLHASLRPYQQHGLRWLHLLSRLRLGACLADDMGLGKTIQVLALLLVRKRAEGPAPSLLLAPASLLANWAQEAARFAPGLRVLVAHTSEMPAKTLGALPAEELARSDLVITSYGSVHRFDWIKDTAWRLVILDEAQAIKNPGTRQTQAVKRLKAGSRLALTGTPIENRLSDLWSLFDFVNPGLLGSAKAFATLTRRLADSPGGYAPLRRLVQPYILRRLKTDKTVINDLPDKTEQNAYCGLSRKQAALYQQAVDDLSRALEDGQEGVERKGLVLAFLTRFKQVCNHPSQWLGDGAWAEPDSGKLARLRELAEVVAAKQEKMLLFSQYAEATAPLAAFLGSIFGRGGCVLTGDTTVKRRQELVSQFQADESVPFFVLSLKAGGSGLNLTAASHVVHFDRWWNPAVENQATDRAFRIGQKRNVLVHKFICRGTVEERIDAMIQDKRQLAADLLDAAGAELRLTELSDAELLRLVRLDLTTATGEA